MALTRDFKQTVAERVQAEPLFARALFNEALTLLLSGEPETARMMLRELINSTVGFEALGRGTDKPAKSLHRMFSANGNPNMDNLAAVVHVLGQELRLSPTVISASFPVPPKRRARVAA
jgi:DNA-binding phage protein